MVGGGGRVGLGLGGGEGERVDMYRICCDCNKHWASLPNSLQLNMIVLWLKLQNSWNHSVHFGWSFDAFVTDNSFNRSAYCVWSFKTSNSSATLIKVLLCHHSSFWTVCVPFWVGFLCPISLLFVLLSFLGSSCAITLHNNSTFLCCSALGEFSVPLTLHFYLVLL